MKFVQAPSMVGDVTEALQASPVLGYVVVVVVTAWVAYKLKEMF